MVPVLDEEARGRRPGPPEVEPRGRDDREGDDDAQGLAARRSRRFRARR